MGMSKELLKGLLDNPNFKKWFGESAVRDAEGLPLKLHHGSNAEDDIEVFKQGFGRGVKGGREYGGSRGVWFTDGGESYARDYGDNITEAYLSLQNPIDLRSDDVISAIRDSGTLKRFGAKPEELLAAIKDGTLIDRGDKGNKVQNAVLKWAKENGYDGAITNDWNRGFDSTSYVAFSPTQIKSPANRGTFDPTDPSILKSAGLMAAGAGAAAYGMTPEDAGAGKLPWQSEAKAQLLSQFFEGLRAGKVQPQVFDDLAALNSKFTDPQYLLTEADIQHLFEQRMLGNKWDADRVVSTLEKLFGSQTARGIQNFPGRGAEEAVWHEQKPRGIFAPVVPGEDGEVRIYSLMDPSPNRVNSYLGKLGDSSGGRMSPPSTFASRERTPSDSVTQLHRAKLSAVDEPSADKDQIMPDTNTVKKIIGLGLLGGTGLAAYGAAAPDDANAMSIGPKGLAGLSGPEKAPQLLSKAERLAGETEARDTASRVSMTPEQRGATPPDLRQDAIVRFDGGESASAPRRREWTNDAIGTLPNIAQSAPLNQQDVGDNSFIETALDGAKTIGAGIDSASKYLGPLIMNAPGRIITAAVNDPIGTASQVADFVVPFKSSAQDYANAFYHNQDATWLDKLNALAGIGLDTAFLGHGNQAKTALAGLMR